MLVRLPFGSQTCGYEVVNSHCRISSGLQGPCVPNTPHKCHLRCQIRVEVVGAYEDTAPCRWQSAETHL